MQKLILCFLLSFVLQQQAPARCSRSEHRSVWVSPTSRVRAHMHAHAPMCLSAMPPAVLNASPALSAVCRGGEAAEESAPKKQKQPDSGLRELNSAAASHTAVPAKKVVPAKAKNAGGAATVGARPPSAKARRSVHFRIAHMSDHAFSRPLDCTHNSPLALLVSAQIGSRKEEARGTSCSGGLPPRGRLPGVRRLVGEDAARPCPEQAARHRTVTQAFHALT